MLMYKCRGKLVVLQEVVDEWTEAFVSDDVFLKPGCWPLLETQCVGPVPLPSQERRARAEENSIGVVARRPPAAGVG